MQKRILILIISIILLSIGISGCIGSSDQQPCPRCNGTGDCQICYGDGYFFSDPCQICQGTGKCSMCDGTGHVTYQKDSQQSGSGSSGSGSDSSSSESSDGDTHQCGACLGDGRCSVCDGKGYSLNYNGSERSDCLTCAGSGKCSQCNGYGRIKNYDLSP